MQLGAITTLLLLRGGNREAIVDKLNLLRGGGLSREAILDKLNRVPTFSIVTADDRVVPMPSPDGDDSEDVCWFTDAAEAQELLELTQAANPEATDLRLAVTPLGHAFDRCGGWVDGSTEDGGYTSGRLMIRGPRHARDASEAALAEQSRAQGIEPAAWCVPVYCHDDFQVEGKMMPFFFSSADFAAGWERSGREAELLPANLAVMDLRMLVHQMETTETFDWSIFTFVSSTAAYALAQELMAAAKGEAGSGA